MYMHVAATYATCSFNLVSLRFNTVKEKQGVHECHTERYKNYPRRQHGEIEEDATVFLLQWEGTKLRDGLQRSKSFIDSYDD